jgi:hypothetical protein
MRLKKYDMVEKVPHSNGKAYLLKYLGGQKLSARQSAIAKCCDCMGYYVDGRMDCKMPDCPLYPFMPYREGEKYKTRTMSEETKKKILQAKSRNTPS